MLYNFYNPTPSAVQAFDNLFVNSRPWVLIYHGSIGSGKSTLLSWLIDNRCRRNRIAYSLTSFDMYSSGIDELFDSAADSVISTCNLPATQANNLGEQITGRITAHWIGPMNVSVVLFFDDYQIFESGSTKDELSLFWDRMIRAHRRLSDLRVVIASREHCHMPDTWFYMQEAAYSML